MEKTKISRSLVRRLTAPLGLAVALLGSGGWGVYHYTTASTVETGMSPDKFAHSASSVKEELKTLFASESHAVSTSKTNGSSTADRYSQPSNSAPTSKSSDRYTLTSAKTANPFATAPSLPGETTKADAAPPEKKQSKSVPDRYADYAGPTPPALPPLAPAPVPADESPTFAATDVTRGQEPSTNPLRTPALETPQEKNRQANVGAKLPIGRPPQTKNQLTQAFSNARPFQQNELPAQENPASPVANSYPPPQTPQLANPRAIELDKGLTMRTPRQPTPRFTQQPPGTPPANNNLVQNTNPLPPASLGSSANLTPTPGLVNNPGTGRPGERLLEGLQNPSITIQKLSPEEIQVGKRCTFAIRVQNTGQRTAQNVQIHDEIPLGTELVGTAPRASISGSQVTWELGMLSVGEERTVEMELIPTEEGELGSVATVLVAAQASAKSRCTRPELALRLSTTKPQVLMGEQQLVQIEVSNPGSGDATGVMLLETVPPGVSHEAGPALEFEIGVLRAGESRRLELILTAEKAGKIQNIMTARADASLQIDASCEFEVIAPELQLSIEGPQKRYLERPATYRVSIENPGTATAHEVQLVTHLPKGLQFVSANNMGEYDSASHTVQWSLAELPANERGTVELVALPIEPGAQTLQIATKAQQGLEDRTEKQVLVEGLAALMFEVADLADPIEIGGETTYEIRVVNQGSKAAGNVQVVAILPPGLRALSGQGETRHTIQGERIAFAPIPSLGPKADTTYRIQVQGTRPGDQRLRVQVTTDEVQQPITKEESTRVYADE